MHASDSSSPCGNSRNSSTFPRKAAEAVNGAARRLLTFLLTLSVLVLSVVASHAPLEQAFASAEADRAAQVISPSGELSSSHALSSGDHPPKENSQSVSDGWLSEAPSETDSESDIELEEMFETELWFPPHDVLSLRVEVRERTSAPPVRALENQWLRDGLERPPRA